jgi:hypothetical protein
MEVLTVKEVLLPRSVLVFCWGLFLENAVPALYYVAFQTVCEVTRQRLKF